MKHLLVFKLSVFNKIFNLLTSCQLKKEIKFSITSFYKGNNKCGIIITVIIYKDMIHYNVDYKYLNKQLT